ncbi:hypothetical protein BCR32DRAFT_283862 [Anaeromyces robustus]|uniref:Uncharacterized protein n=1 Tax=Anaeromyces robustus TaxID=1754192 RepID=A0A1Y1WT55_9FUNG|nr:hypothetical protein BCR32DRAFT_283862 [Anaeromyces robustus]|eukprot:ORX76713.1 hypothetical protein BCR32DRAFT_283862 [Anaeromyces robustus]
MEPYIYFYRATCFKNKYEAVFNLVTVFFLNISTLKNFPTCYPFFGEKIQSFSDWIFICKAFERDKNTIFNYADDLFLKLTYMRIMSLEISKDLYEDYEDNIYPLMLNTFLDGYYTFEKLILMWNEDGVMNYLKVHQSLLFPVIMEHTPGVFIGVDVEKVRRGIYSDTDLNSIPFHSLNGRLEV